MRYAAVYIGSNLEFNFFSRMIYGLRELEYELIILSNKLSIIIKAINHRFKYSVVTKNSSVKSIPDLSGSYDIENGSTSFEKAALLYSSVYNAFREISEQYQLEYIFIWNGLSIQTIAVSNYAKDFSIKTRYFELSNIPGKLFVNPNGVNARSSLFYNIHILQEYPAGETEFQKWRKKFINYKSNNNLLPQCMLSKIQNYLFLLDIAGFKLFNLPSNGETNVLKKVKLLFSTHLHFQYDNYDYNSKRYVFLPLQVNLDTQLAFNSDLSNLDAIKKAIEVSSELNAELVVKIHPAESDKNLIKKLIDLKKEYSFYIANYCTFDLISHSVLVIVINSTAGLESMILGKNVKILGKSFYLEMNQEYLRNYILKYLINAEYFSDKVINRTEVKKILDIK